MFDSNLSILIVNENHSLLKETSGFFNDDFVAQILTLRYRSQLESYLLKHPIHLVVLEAEIEKASERDYISRVLEKIPDIPLLVTTGSSHFQHLIDTMKRGTFDVLSRPLEYHRLHSTVVRALEFHDLRREIEQIRTKGRYHTKLKEPELQALFTSQDPGMQSLFQHAEAVAPNNDCLLLTGEQGVGKVRMARSIHQLSGRTGSCKLLELNKENEPEVLAYLTEHLNQREHYLEQHTFFLNDITSLSGAGQKKLYALIAKQDKNPILVMTSRLIACTNQDLRTQMEAGKFLSELYYRFVMHHVNIPSLRQRSKDYKMLVEQLVVEAADAFHKNRPMIPKQVTTLLASYDFPGNISELKKIVFTWVEENTAKSLAAPKLKKILKEFQQQTSYNRSATVVLNSLNYNDAKQTLVEKAMQQAGNNQSVAAELLGFSRQTLSNYLNSLNPKKK